MIEASQCPFIDSHAAWMLREMNDHGVSLAPDALPRVGTRADLFRVPQYRKYDTDRTPYGLGYEMLLLKDTRKMPDVYLGRFYDFSIDPE